MRMALWNPTFSDNIRRTKELYIRIHTGRIVVVFVVTLIFCGSVYNPWAHVLNKWVRRDTFVGLCKCNSRNASLLQPNRNIDVATKVNVF